MKKEVKLYLVQSFDFIQLIKVFFYKKNIRFYISKLNLLEDGEVV